MDRRTRDEKLEIATEFAVKMAPYLWEQQWGFGLNVYFDDVHVDLRELKTFLFSEDQAMDEALIREKFMDACVEESAKDDAGYQAYQDILSLDGTIEMYIDCEQEIYEQIYFCLWDDQPSGRGMVDALNETFRSHQMIWDLEDYSIEIYNDEPF